VAPPPPDGSRGCMGTMRRPVGGVGHIVSCARARQVAQTALQANSGAHVSSAGRRLGGGVEWACRRTESANTASIALQGMGQRLMAVSALLVQSS
jgi:hypothetical protein